VFPEKGFVDSKNINKNLGIKAITHAVSNKSTFLKIIKDRKIKLPSMLDQLKKKTPFVENLYGLNDCNYFSAGFDYNSKFHQWPFAFLFRKSILKREQFHTFKSYIVAKSWFVFLKHLKKYDLNTLLEARKKRTVAKKSIDKFLETGRPGLFWKFENVLIWAYENTKVKKRVKKEMVDFIKSKELSNNYAPVFIGKHYHDNYYYKEIEICSTAPVSLDDKEFIGVYIKKEKINKMIPILKRSFSGEIIVYDGKKAKKLSAF